MRTSIATISVGGTLDVTLRSVAAAGFDGVEIMDADLVATPLSPAQVAARCADLGLAVEILQPVRDVVGITREAFVAAERRFRQRLVWAGELGTDRVLVCSTVGPQAVDDPDLLAAQLDRLGDLAAEAGVTIAYEALSWGTCVDHVGQTWAAVRAIDHPAVGVAVDTFHIGAVGDDASALTGIPGDKIAFVQVADAPHLQMSPLQWSRHHRCFPGQGSLDVTSLVGAVLDAGYDGPLSLEVFSDLVREADPLLTARDGLRSLLYLEDDVRRRAAADGVDGPAATVTHGRGHRPATGIDLAVLPDPAAGPSAVGVHVEAPPGSALADALDRLGLERLDGAGTPARAAAVAARGATPARWRHGEAVVTLTPGDRAVAPAHVDALVLAVDAPASLAERGALLLWPTTTDGTTTSLAAPSGVRVDAVPRQTARRTTEGIDHVGTVVLPEASDAELSFYRQLFALDAGPITEFPDPMGRLRSRDLRGAGDGLRMVLNIEVRRTGDHGAPGPGINQLALRCSDLLARVRAAREAGAPLLRPPAGYYDDLEARLAPDPTLMAELRRLGVFYDRDETGGELLHAYTPVLDGAVYVELLERRGGYDGYGAAATPVRLALQSRAAPQG